MSFLLSKFTPRSLSRTTNTFNQAEISHSNWWIIPQVRKRWNKLISGNENIIYEDYMMENYLSKENNIRLLSIGSGSCSHELALAKYSNFEEIVCVDLAQNRLDEAKNIAKERQLTNLTFNCKDILSNQLEKNSFDIVFFHQSLHHFKNIEKFISSKIYDCLTPSGKLIINEYVGPTRNQYSKKQIKSINKALKIIPKKYRKRFKTNLVKNTFYGSGILRMILADPSEGIDSANIMPSIKAHFKTIVEKPYGGNLLMGVFKDISHHFIKLNVEKRKILDALFEFEDNYLESNRSDFLFGIYQKN